MAVSTQEVRTVLPDYQRDFLEKLLTDVRDTATQPVEFPEIQIAVFITMPPLLLW